MPYTVAVEVLRIPPLTYPHSHLGEPYPTHSTSHLDLSSDFSLSSLLPGQPDDFMPAFKKVSASTSPLVTFCCEQEDLRHLLEMFSDEATVGQR